jgi:hypothetical protein
MLPVSMCHTEAAGMASMRNELVLHSTRDVTAL